MGYFQLSRCDPRGFKDSSKMLKNYKELKVWQKSYKLCLEIYRITAKFPKEERYGLTSQIRRSVVSIPSNIAEGYGRKTTRDYIRMLYIILWFYLWIGNADIISRGFRFNLKGCIGYAKKRHCRKRKNVKVADKVFRKQTLESLTPWILGPSSSTKLEKNRKK